MRPAFSHRLSFRMARISLFCKRCFMYSRPPAHEAFRPACRASGYTACSCSRHSTARCAPLPADHRRGPLQKLTEAEAPCRGMWATSFRVPSVMEIPPLIIVRGGSTPCCRPLITYHQRRRAYIPFILTVGWLGWLC